MATKGTLEKLSIVAFSDAKLTIPVGAYVAMYNPNTYSISHSQSYDEGAKISGGTADQKSNKRTPRSLTMELFFDGTATSPSSKNSGVEGIADSKLNGKIKSAIQDLKKKKTVSAQITAFLAMTYSFQSTKHRPPFLIFLWGDFIFPGVLESANVSYSLFNSDGTPLRAKISVTVKEHITSEKLNLELRLSSPDLTHSRVIMTGDTLPNLAKEIYEDESLYLEVAAANNLTNYRKLKPGTQLIFPPIEKIKGRT